MFRGRHYNVIVLIVIAAVTAGCDKAQLLAPTQSTISLSAPTRVLPSNGTTPLTATVLEQAGTPVHNGTTVRFTTSLGRVDPVEAQTTNGIAITTFFAGPNSGIADIRATSGAAKAEGDINLVKITIGAAAVNTVTVRANPSSIGPNGGTVELIATVVGENGQAVEGVLVSFNADQGSLGSTTAVTNSSGEARTTLTTSQQTIVTATAGTKTSSNLTIAARAGPAVTIVCATIAAGGTCSSVQASGSNNNATVVFTVTKGSTSPALRSATLDFGDGTAQALGTLAGGPATVPHTYAGPDTSNARSYTATVLATDINGESTSASVIVLVTPRPTPTPINVNLTAVADPANDHRWTFTATATEGTAAPSVQSYTWDFGDDSGEVRTSGNITSHVYTDDGIMQVTVTVRTADGRTGVGRTEIRVLP
jgi:PKD domain-containing protein/Big-like domain-containing protein